MVGHPVARQSVCSSHSIARAIFKVQYLELRNFTGLPKDRNMTTGIELHAPSQPVLVVGVLVALLAIILYFVPGIANANYAFWLMTLAYVVSSLGTIVKT
jgi:hypothetical protein